MFLDLVRKAKKCLQRLKRLRKKTRKTPGKKKTRKKKPRLPQKPANTRKSWNLVVLDCFRKPLEFQNTSHFVYVGGGRSAEIFPETYMFGTKWIMFLVVWPIFLEHLRTIIFFLVSSHLGLPYVFGGGWSPGGNGTPQCLRPSSVWIIIPIDSPILHVGTVKVSENPSDALPHWNFCPFTFRKLFERLKHRRLGFTLGIKSDLF